MKTLLIDNYDSFTFNLFQMIADLNGDVPLVIRNDELGWSDLAELEFDNVVISPGPGCPQSAKDFGICARVIRETTKPLLGVCLGHQGLGCCFGAVVTRAPEPMHGRTSVVYHNNSDLFEGIPHGFSVVRYHSLIVQAQLPESLEKTAWTADGLVMGIRHRQRPLWGVQFHPESILTEHGRRILENFEQLTRRHRGDRRQRAHGRTTRAVPAPDRTPPFPPARQSRVSVLWRRLSALPDPERVYLHQYARRAVSFWLDSSQISPGHSRFSFMGDASGPLSKLVRYNCLSGQVTIRTAESETEITTSIFEYLRCELDKRTCSSPDLPFDFNCGFVGYFGYELRQDCGSDHNRSSATPDAAFIFADRLIAFDHLEEATYLVCLADSDTMRQAEGWLDEMSEGLFRLPELPANPDIPSGIVCQLVRSEDRYLRDIEECVKNIYSGESYELCLTNKLRVDIAIDPLVLYRALRKVNPAPYSAFIRFEDYSIACSSPERFLKIGSDGSVESKPIKGTLARVADPGEDCARRERLRASVKDRAENLMIVDLIRNDIGRVCEVGTVHVPKLMDVETYATVHQLVSTIRGRLRPGLSAVDCIRAAFPGGSMTGAPKLRTMDILDLLEAQARGIYSGSLGFLALNGSADLNIVIRTAVVLADRVEIGVGGAIVSLSDPDEELREIVVKAEAVTRAFPSCRITM